MRLGTRALVSPREVTAMGWFRTIWTRLFKDDDGPTAVEYAVMLALIIAVCIAAISKLGVNAWQIFDNVSDTLEGTPW
jgi:pilus assembly protein Flp/PilA